MDYTTVHGVEIPKIGLGTWALRGKNCTRVILNALDLGYRHIDTAQMYGNERAVGNALSKAAVSRDEIFLTTKIKGGNFRKEMVIKSAYASLKKLQSEYIDLLLIHWPSRQVPIAETIEAMNQLQSEGLVRHVGVSNFSVEETREAMDASETPILTNQVEYQPYRSQQSILKFCEENNMVLTAYTPLAKGRIVSGRIFQEIGEKYEKSAVQTALRWLTQQKPVVAIPKASSEIHLKENIEIFDFSLSDEEMDQIFALQ